MPAKKKILGDGVTEVDADASGHVEVIHLETSDEIKLFESQKPKQPIHQSKLQEIFDSRPYFYGGEQPEEMMQKIRQLHKFYEELRGLLH